MTRLIRRRNGATLHAPDDTIKMLQETLSVAQARIHHAAPDDPRNPSHVARLQRLIDDCARQRPVGSDGKHGERHTRTCGCEDAAPTWLAWLWMGRKGWERVRTRLRTRARMRPGADRGPVHPARLGGLAMTDDPLTSAHLLAAAAIVAAEADERGIRHWTDLADRLTREAALRAVPREESDDEQ